MSREEFNALIEKYLSGKASPAEERLIDDFFSAQENMQADGPSAPVSEEIWAAVNRKAGVVPERATGWVNTNNVRRFSRLMKMSVATVLMFALVYAGVSVYWQGNKIAGSPVSLVTATSEKGQKSLVTLADGTRVYLNSASSITYPEEFESDEREIILSGEAFFEVTRDEKRPFTVRTADVVTRVLGTSFNVEAFEGEDIKVTVVTGKVQVRTGSGQSGPVKDEVILQPNEQAVYNGDSTVTLKNIDVDKFVAWKSNRLYFDGNSLSEVVAELERWYNVTITFESDNIKGCRINGQYKDMGLEGVLKSIQYMYQVDFRYLNQNSIELYGKGCK